MISCFRIARCLFCAVKWMLMLFLSILIIDLGLFYTIGFTINPMNQWFFVVAIRPPHDYYVPEIVMPIEKGRCEYEFEYKHRYPGPHEISLNVVDKNGNKDGFFQFSSVNGVEVEVVVSHSTMTTYRKRWVCNKKIHYMGTTINLPIIRYDSKNHFDRNPYRVTLKITGPLDELIQKHPESYWSVRNATNK